MTTVIDLESRRAKLRDDARLVIVEAETDRRNANRIFYHIIAETFADVQSEIDARTAEAESFGNGYAQFFGPVRCGPGFEAIGEVVTCP